jgi:hypothetical protein
VYHEKAVYVITPLGAPSKIVKIVSAYRCIQTCFKKIISCPFFASSHI